MMLGSSAASRFTYRAGDRADPSSTAFDDSNSTISSPASTRVPYLRQIDENQVAQLVKPAYSVMPITAGSTLASTHMLVGVFQMIRDFEIRAILPVRYCSWLQRTA